MIGHDDIDADAVRIFDLFHGANAGIDGYNQANACRYSKIDCPFVHSIAFSSSMRNIIIKIRA
ncbi:hypothetical protein D3C84_1083700 [compost metagenome]